MELTIYTAALRTALARRAECAGLPIMRAYHRHAALEAIRWLRFYRARAS